MVQLKPISPLLQIHFRHRFVIVIYLIVLSALPVFAQENIVPNSSFESYDNLQCRLENSILKENLQNWFQPIWTTTDYWNENVPVGCSVRAQPEIALPHTGHGMIGIITGYRLNGRPMEYKEYAAVKLKHKLTKGKMYRASFFAKALTKSLGSQNAADIMFSDNIGMAFSTEKIETIVDRSIDHMSLTPEFRSDKVIGGEWEKIEGCFVADEAYEYLYIGNFSPYASTTYEYYSYNGLFLQLAYYFLDDIYLEELPYDVSTLKNELPFCYYDDDLKLDASVAGASAYLWDDLSNGSSISTTLHEDRDYHVKISFEQCIYDHTFHVSNIPKLDLGKDTVLCEGEELILSPLYFGEDLSWSDGSSARYKKITSSVSYTVTVNSKDCDVSDDIVVKVVKCPEEFPNIFTPNSDELNQYLVFPNIEIRPWEILIYNRWGQKIYYSPEYHNDWNGDDAEEGVYYYRLSSQALHRSVTGWIQIRR